MKFSFVFVIGCIRFQTQFVCHLGCSFMLFVRKDMTFSTHSMI